MTAGTSLVGGTLAAWTVFVLGERRQWRGCRRQRGDRGERVAVTEANVGGGKRHEAGSGGEAMTGVGNGGGSGGPRAGAAGVRPRKPIKKARIFSRSCFQFV